MFLKSRHYKWRLLLLMEGLRRMLTLKQIHNRIFFNWWIWIWKDSYFTAVLLHSHSSPGDRHSAKDSPEESAVEPRTEPGQSRGLRPSLSQHQRTRAPLSSHYIFYSQSLHLPFYCNALSRSPLTVDTRTVDGRGTEEPQTLLCPRTSVWAVWAKC